MNDKELLDYFKGLSIRDILQLARKSIMLTTENGELENKISNINKIKEICESEVVSFATDIFSNEVERKIAHEKAKFAYDILTLIKD